MSEKDPSSPFNTSAADTERLAWRIDGALPTERALGRDEVLARENAAQVEAVRAEKLARQKELEIRLGTIASDDLRPDDN